MANLQTFTIDTCGNILTVQAGVRFKDVLPELQSRGLGLKNYPAIVEQTLVGAIMTSTLGSGQDPSRTSSPSSPFCRVVAAVPRCSGRALTRRRRAGYWEAWA
mmetsp:Transcript_167141/g.536837  ORF Transcript_167141/g.536837 Transcript_167141/m.536837 type:complete len:103 (-) Transcript_167141:970-1278(-)